jgi:hypothetical protein
MSKDKDIPLFARVSAEREHDLSYYREAYQLLLIRLKYYHEFIKQIDGESCSGIMYDGLTFCFNNIARLEFAKDNFNKIVYFDGESISEFISEMITINSQLDEIRSMFRKDKHYLYSSIAISRRVVNSEELLKSSRIKYELNMRNSMNRK